MNRVKLENGNWFDRDAAKCFKEDTYWDGNNWISKPTGSQWAHQEIYQTAKGQWVLHSWSAWQGSNPSWEVIDHITAYQWLIENNHEQEVPAEFLNRMEI